MHYVYILRLGDNSLYVGSAADLKKRVVQHKQGLVISTKNLRPINIAWYCAFNNKKSATDFEKYLKSGSGFSWRKGHLGL